MKIKAKITLLFDQNGANLEIHDEASSMTFVQIRLTSEQVCQMMSRLSRTECQDAEVNCLERVGKTLEHKKFEFKLGPTGFTRDRDELARKLIGIKCPKGWVADTDFCSQGSFFYKNDEQWARTTIRRWV